MLLHRRVRGRRLREARDQRGLGERELIEILLEVALRRGRDAPRAGAEIDLVEIDREDRVLRVRRLEPAREDRFLRLARQRLLGAEELLGDLLRDRRAALREVAGGDVRPHRAGDALEVDAAVIEVVVILDREERVDELLRDLLVRHELAPLLRELAEQRAVGGVDARHRGHVRRRTRARSCGAGPTHRCAARSSRRGRTPTSADSTRDDRARRSRRACRPSRRIPPSARFATRPARGATATRRGTNGQVAIVVATSSRIRKQHSAATLRSRCAMTAADPRRNLAHLACTEKDPPKPATRGSAAAPRRGHRAEGVHAGRASGAARFGSGAGGSRIDSGTASPHRRSTPAGPSRTEAKLRASYAKMHHRADARPSAARTMCTADDHGHGTATSRRRWTSCSRCTTPRSR